MWTALHEKRRIRPWALRECQLPDEVIARDGYPKRRPTEWMLPGDGRTEDDPTDQHGSE
ncbi:MAG: hypothetical protein IT431_09760 [Phycisphaerales bacterium]|nr:hypothetical protein [Phycisphaerales bacterium]